MEIWQSVLVALVQGLTEFLPISSSGHMVLVEAILEIETPGAVWEVAFHLGTLLAVFAVFWEDLWHVAVGSLAGAGKIVSGTKPSEVWRGGEHFRLGVYIVLATIPAAVVGLTLKDSIEAAFSRPILAAVLIFVTGEVLWLTRPHGLTKSGGDLRTSDSIVIGIAQAFALFPGISRSGTTIATGLMRGVDRTQAARFSFLLSVPAILGATVLQAPDLRAIPGEHILPLIVGMAVAAVSGYAALVLLLRIVRAGKLHLFAYYCRTAAILGVTYLWGMHYAATH